MRRVLSVWLPRWPIDRLNRAALPDKPRRPCVLAATIGNQRLVSAVDARAAAEGIAPGMPLADARALRPDLAVAAADFAGDAAALARLAAWCGRYSPWTAPCAPDGIWLDVTGCAHLQGGEAGLVAELVARLARRGIAAQAAIADTAGAAWGVARYGDAPTVLVPAQGQRAALAELPVAALRLAPEVTALLMRLGLRRVGELYPLPRPALVLRFGAGLAARLDQALGALAEPLSPLPPPSLRWTRRRFAEPIATREDIRAATAALLHPLCRSLAAAGLGARRLELTLYRVDGTPVAAMIGTARPSHEPHHLLRLLDERFDGLDPGLGIEDMLLAATIAEPQAARQLDLDSCPHPGPPPHAGEGGTRDSGRVGAAVADAADLAELVDRLTARLGEGAVGRPVLRESHWPERAVRLVPPLDPARNAAACDHARPVRLFVRPEQIDATAPVPDDPPLFFRWRHVLHRVRRADGPERIAGEWWRGASELRDYYRVEDESGRRFWLYRAGLHRGAVPARWFVHGVFA